MFFYNRVAEFAVFIIDWVFRVGAVVVGVMVIVFVILFALGRDERWFLGERRTVLVEIFFLVVTLIGRTVIIGFVSLVEVLGDRLNCEFKWMWILLFFVVMILVLELYFRIGVGIVCFFGVILRIVFFMGMFWVSGEIVILVGVVDVDIVIIWMGDVGLSVNAFFLFFGVFFLENVVIVIGDMVRFVLRVVFLFFGFWDIIFGDGIMVIFGFWFFKVGMIVVLEKNFSDVGFVIFKVAVLFSWFGVIRICRGWFCFGERISFFGCFGLEFVRGFFFWDIGGSFFFFFIYGI